MGLPSFLLRNSKSVLFKRKTKSFPLIKVTNENSYKKLYNGWDGGKPYRWFRNFEGRQRI
jgi:hypothetical protein